MGNQIADSPRHVQVGAIASAVDRISSRPTSTEPRSRNDCGLSDRPRGPRQILTRLRAPSLSPTFSVESQTATCSIPNNDVKAAKDFDRRGSSRVLTMGPPFGVDTLKFVDETPLRNLKSRFHKSVLLHATAGAATICRAPGRPECPRRAFPTVTNGAKGNYRGIHSCDPGNRCYFCKAAPCFPAVRKADERRPSGSVHRHDRAPPVRPGRCIPG